MQSKATTPAKYIAELPPDRRAAISTVHKTIMKNLNKGFEEGMAYGMIAYSVPKSLYPPGYHCDPSLPLGFAGLASQKNYMSLYVMCGSRQNEAWLRSELAKSGRKLDMGKCCIRFKKLEDLPLEVVGQIIKRTTVKQYVEWYEKSRADAVKAKAKRTAANARGSTNKAKSSKSTATRRAKSSAASAR
ncbi:MAG: DUF1801 domain-containing protein [Planctomycetes bacterium]|nr:DUF1801 domain-containing protein [Planctomycetota bacterium]